MAVLKDGSMIRYRRGVAYRNRATAQRFGASAGGPGVEARRPFRGFTPEERGPIQVRPLTRPGEMRGPGSPPSEVERQTPQQREAPGRGGFLNSRVVALPVRCPANKEVVAHFRVSAVVA